jgi:hypothetical protein
LGVILHSQNNRRIQLSLNFEQACPAVALSLLLNNFGTFDDHTAKPTEGHAVFGQLQFVTGLALSRCQLFVTEILVEVLLLLPSADRAFRSAVQQGAVAAHRVLLGA